MTLLELIEAYKTGAISRDDPLWIDNDVVFVYVDGPNATEDDSDGVCVFRSDPWTLTSELLDIVGIPYEGV